MITLHPGDGTIRHDGVGFAEIIRYEVGLDWLYVAIIYMILKDGLLLLLLLTVANPSLSASIPL